MLILKEWELPIPKGTDRQTEIANPRAQVGAKKEFGFVRNK